MTDENPRGSTLRSAEADMDVTASIFDPSTTSITDAARLLEANEHLVLGMMRAQADIETVTRSVTEITRLAELDPLTGLPNRVLLLDRFAQAIAIARRHESAVALLFIDLDRFKEINDTAGHAAGDRALKQVARCLLSVVRKADTVSRHGGDEFLILLTEVAHPSDAALIAAKVIAALARMRPGVDAGTGLTASIGISIFPTDGDDAQTLIAAADEAMYRAKHSGPGHFRFHRQEVEQDEQVSASAPRKLVQPGVHDTGGPPAGALQRELRDTNEQLLFAALRESDERRRVEESLQMTLDAAEMGSWEMDLQTGHCHRSPRHDVIFGHTDRIAHWDVQALVEAYVPEDRAAVSEAFRCAETSGVFDFEQRIGRGNDGAVRWLHMKGQIFREGGQPRRIAGVVADVTDRRAIEGQLRQAQKMEAVGQLTGGIAHDFNNLLLVIGGSLELLARRLPADEQTSRLLDSARRGVDSGAKLNRQLLAFARRQDLKLESVNIGGLHAALEQLLRRAADESISVSVTCSPDLWPCHTDANQLQVAILNLAINARDAMRDGGTLWLTATNRSVTNDFASRCGATAGDYVAVAVADTGEGMTVDVLDHAFEPFFTTKAVGKGTGLGLSQVYGFATQSGGFVSMESGPLGTTVTIHLPRTLETSDDAQPLHLPSGRMSARTGVVLLVEDNAEVRAVSRAMLDDLGYSVIEAGTADAAVAIVRSGAVVDVMFSDLIMPGMSVVDLVAEMKRLRPGLPVLLTSGYTAQRTILDDTGGGLRLLRKPYSQGSLSQAIREAIEGNRNA